ncbi:MAG: phosphatase PAP2 family protein [Oscillospiraceae bacterium]|nr:phosphatase PAP2 family protein [Oscillospiraceae bacterium]
MLLALLNQLAVSFDLPILDWIQAHLQSGFMDTIMPIITIFGDAGIFWIACAVVLLFFPKTRKIGLGMGIAMALGLLVCNVTLKPLVARIRPYDFQIKELGKTWNDILLAGKLLVETPHDFSFPSGHTIASFEAATVLLINNKKLKVGIPALILAILIAFSRLYLYVHYPTDVIFSVFAGILFGIIGHLLAQKIKLPSGKKGKYQR